MKNFVNGVQFFLAFYMALSMQFTLAINQTTESAFLLKGASFGECSCGVNGVRYATSLHCVDPVSGEVVPVRNCVSGSPLVNSNGSGVPFERCFNSSLSCNPPQPPFWKTYPWFPCDEQNYTTRHVICIDALFRKLDDEICLQQTPKPVNVKKCHETVSDCVVSKFDWSKCEPCAQGDDAFQLATRQIITPSINGGTLCPKLHIAMKCPKAGVLCNLPNISNHRNGTVPNDSFAPLRVTVNFFEICDGADKSEACASFVSRVQIDDNESSVELTGECHNPHQHYPTLKVQKAANSEAQTSPIPYTCIKCENYRWSCGQFGLAINTLSGLLSTAEECGPYQRERAVFCTCTDSAGDSHLMPEGECQSRLGDPETSLEEGERECGPAARDCDMTPWTAWSPCVDFHPGIPEYASSRGYRIRTRDLNEDQSPSVTTCRVTSVFAQAKICYQPRQVHIEVVLRNTSHEPSDVVSCGDHVTNCYTNISYSVFNGRNFTGVSSSDFCEVTPVPCGDDECVLTEWNSWSDWLPTVSSLMPSMNKDVQYFRVREKRILQFGQAYDEKGERYFECGGQKHYTNTEDKFKVNLTILESEIVRETTVHNYNGFFELVPIPSITCAHGESHFEDSDADQSLVSGYRNISLEWRKFNDDHKHIPSGTPHQKVKLLRTLNLGYPAFTTACQSPAKLDCQTSNWSNWFASESGGLQRFRKAVRYPQGGGEECGTLQETNGDYFKFRLDRDLGCRLHLPQYANSSFTFHTLKCVSLLDGTQVDPFLCLDLPAPPQFHQCHAPEPDMAATLPELDAMTLVPTLVTKSATLPRLKFSPQKPNINEMIAREESEARDFVGAEWSACFGCTPQFRVQQPTGYQLRHLAPHEYKKLCSWVEEARAQHQSKSMEVRGCLLDRAPLYRLVSLGRSFSFNADSESPQLPCGVGSVSPYQTPDYQRCFYYRDPSLRETLAISDDHEDCQMLVTAEDYKHRVPCSVALEKCPGSSRAPCYNASIFIPSLEPMKITNDMPNKDGRESENMRSDVDWSEWSQCSSLRLTICGHGTRVRTRSNCPQPASGNRGTPAPCKFLEEQPCFVECPSCIYSQHTSDIIVHGEATHARLPFNTSCQPNPTPPNPLAVPKPDRGCLLSNWSDWPWCISETGEAYFTFRTRQPMAAVQVANGECDSLTDGDIVHHRECTDKIYPEDDYHTIEFLISHKPNYCFAHRRNTDQYQLVDPLLTYQKCSCPLGYRATDLQCVRNEDGSAYDWVVVLCKCVSYGVSFLLLVAIVCTLKAAIRIELQLRETPKCLEKRFQVKDRWLARVWPNGTGDSSQA